MRIGVISDTHGNTVSIHRAIEVAGPVDMWLHAGDHCQDAPVLVEATGVPVKAVAGNCDGAVAARIDEFIEAGGKRIWMTHGHRYRAKERHDELAWWARQYDVDVVVYGHSHVAKIIWDDGLLIFNPGSTYHPRGGRGATCGVIEIKDGRVEATIIDI